MTLNEIIVTALGRLGRSTDTYTVDSYRSTFAAYADAAVLKIARLYKAATKESIPLTVDNTFLLSELDHGCDRILSVKVGGHSVEFFQEVYGDGEFSIELPKGLEYPISIDSGVLKEAAVGSIVLEFKYDVTDLAAKYMNCPGTIIYCDGHPLYAKSYTKRNKKLALSKSIDYAIAADSTVSIGYKHIDVIYRYVPKTLVSGIDAPEIPEAYHPLIVHYVVACDRAGGDPYTNSTANVDFTLFNEGLNSIKPAHKYEPDHFRLKWY